MPDNKSTKEEYYYNSFYNTSEYQVRELQDIIQKLYMPVFLRMI